MTNARADFVVIGSGAAGLTAALSAASAGASVIVLEKSGKIGGTTSFSGALLWVPMNPKGGEIGFTDNRDTVINYIQTTAGETPDISRTQAFVDNAAETIGFLESASPLRFLNTLYPDTFVEAKGGVANGRHLEPAFLSMGVLGRWRKHLRQAATPPVLNSTELLGQGFLAQFKRIIQRNAPRLAWRMLTQKRSGGMALIIGLLEACIKRGVQIELNTGATELLQDGDRVIGVQSGARTFMANRAVILACGGFEHDRALSAQYLPAPLERLASPPDLAGGDNVRLAQQAGAELANMNVYWNWPSSATPRSVYEGKDIGLLVIGERTLPHCMWVNRAGARFCNESEHNVAFAFEKKDSAGQLENLPAWSIFDRQFREKYPVMFSLMPGAKDPDWLTKADTLEQLAARIGVDGAGLTASVKRFNTMAQRGKDEDFGRGDHAYERTFGDRDAPHPNLGPIEKPPFYALPIYASAVGTRGGARTDAHGRVLRHDGGVIAGLYGAGNAVASFFAPRIMAGGATLMPAMTFARLAVKHALQTNHAGPEISG